MPVLSVSSFRDPTFYYSVSTASYFHAISQAAGPNYALLSQSAQAGWLSSSGELD